MTVILAQNNIVGKLVHCDPDSRAIIAELLSYDVDGAERSSSFKMGIWNGKRTFLRADDKFDSGFTNMIRRALTERSIPITVHDLRPQLTVADVDPNIANILNGIELYDYQIEAILAFLRSQRGVLRLPTGSGKTEVSLAITKLLGLKTLFLTHKVDLVEQTAKRYEDRLGVRVGKISEGDFAPSHITVASVQTMLSQWSLWWRAEGEGRKNKLQPLKPMAKSYTAKDLVEAIQKARGFGIERFAKQPQIIRDRTAEIENFLASVQLLIVDEAHRVAGETFFRVAGATLNATYRLGLTATPNMRESREDNLKLIAACGDVVYSIPMKLLIERGVVAQPRFTIYEVPPAVGVRKRDTFEYAYSRGIVENDVRNAIIIEATRKLLAHKPVVLVTREAHGQRLLKMATQRGLKAIWVSGKTGAVKDRPKIRRRALDMLRDGAIDTIFASTIFDEGLDEPSIGAIVNAGGLKAQIPIFQRVGRSVRLKRDGRAQEAFIVDFLDTGNDHLSRHAVERYEAIKSEEAWIIDNVVPYDAGEIERLLDMYELEESTAKRKNTGKVDPADMVVPDWRQGTIFTFCENYEVL